MLYFPSARNSYSISDNGFRANVGDIIILRTASGFQVSGYVFQRSSVQVILSHVDPGNIFTSFKRISDEDLNDPIRRKGIASEIEEFADMLTDTTKVYDLKDFESYEILREGSKSLGEIIEEYKDKFHLPIS